LLSELAGLLVVVHDLIVEHGKVEGQSESNWVASVEALGGLLGKLVVLQGTVFDSVELGTLSALGNVPVVVSDHLIEESLGLIGGGDLHARALHGIDDLEALIVELLLDLLLVGGKTIVELLVLWILLDGADGPNSSSLGADLIFKSNR